MHPSITSTSTTPKPIPTCPNSRLRYPIPDRDTVTRLMLSVVSIEFAIYMVPGLWGAPCKAISAFAPPMGTQDFKLGEQAVTTYHDYEEGMAAARKAGKPMLVDFSYSYNEDVQAYVEFQQSGVNRYGR